MTGKVGGIRRLVAAAQMYYVCLGSYIARYWVRKIIQWKKAKGEPFFVRGGGTLSVFCRWMNTIEGRVQERGREGGGGGVGDWTNGIKKTKREQNERNELKFEIELKKGEWKQQ